MPTKKEKFAEVNRLLRLYMIQTQRFIMQQTSILQVTPQQAHTLAYIKKHPGLIQRELSDFFHLRNASVTNMVKNLERDGLIERKIDPKSARNKRIYLTKKGEEIAQDIEDQMNRLNQQIVDRLDEKDIDNLLTSLENVIQSLDSKD
ncbi:MarR family transcriptional regulator [Lactobacillus acidophilus]|uniref:MarR family winged helix-turn-helix transcriptional regulator n=1 Tax=Lactobacillus acidophilus TaxID=1579 RepID=UPI0021A4E79F|nr:MarR family transcriptional regulator [Lactobacillus acidophilus]MCT3602483.1 MarR family transcriptional regulator [Lactobacillus acidophilus]MCT3623591.1 MarR family transcriptional regulator [Lactobacillus acidophilus]